MLVLQNFLNYGARATRKCFRKKNVRLITTGGRQQQSFRAIDHLLTHMRFCTPATILYGSRVAHSSVLR